MSVSHWIYWYVMHATYISSNRHNCFLEFNFLDTTFCSVRILHHVIEIYSLNSIGEREHFFSGGENYIDWCGDVLYASQTLFDS
jgi:hypothetical protein